MRVALRILVFLALVALPAAPARAQDATGVSIWPGDATPEWRDSPSGAAFAALYGDPEREGAFAFLMKMPADWTMRPHTHDTGEYLTVLSGTLYMTFEPDGEWTELAPGSVIAISAGVPMWAKTGEAETVLQVSGAGPFHTEAVTETSLVARARRFVSLLDAADYDAARAMMAPDPRRWWGEPEGEGQPWRIEPGTPGPWAAWDDHFESKKELVEWREGPDSATAILRETNDYYRLLERGWVTNAITYHFDDEGRIAGWSIETVGERPPGRTEAFLEWARVNASDEIAALMPDGEIDPSGDHPERFRRLLERWRREAGLEPIE